MFLSTRWFYDLWATPSPSTELVAENSNASFDFSTPSLPPVINYTSPVGSLLLKQDVCSCTFLFTFSYRFGHLRGFSSEQFHCCLFKQLPNISVIAGEGFIKHVSLDGLMYQPLVCLLPHSSRASWLSSAVRAGMLTSNPGNSFPSLLQSTVEAKYL